MEKIAIKDEINENQEAGRFGIRKFYLAAFIACMGQVSQGSVQGYSSPALLSIANNNSGFEELSEEQKSWTGSIISIGALFGGLVGGPFIDYYGRRTLIIVSLLPFVGGWLAIALSGRFVIMMIGRLITGFCVGLMCLVTPVYASEVAPASVRGFVGTGIQLCAFIGVFLAFLIGEQVDWSGLAYICIIFPVICSVPMFFLPESPRWLMKVGRKQQALKAVKFLYGKSVNAEQECKDMETKGEDNKNKKSLLSEFKRKEVLHPLALVLFIMVVQQWVGFSAVLFFAGDIFKMAGYTTITPSTSAIILACSQCGGTIISSFIIDRAGRKILLILSGLIMALALAALSVVFLLQELNGPSYIGSYGWITVVSLSVYVGAFAMGFGPIGWLMMGEMLPVKVKGPASALATAVNFLNSFLCSKLFHTMKDSMKSYGVFFFFMGVCIVASVFVWLFLPETKGKSLEEIERLFSKDKTSRKIRKGDYESDED